MPALPTRAAWALLAAFAISSPARAMAGSDVAARVDRPWFLPDHGKLQLAGNIGLLSAGIGYALAGSSVELDLLYGWVPAEIAPDASHSVTGKITWVPWRLRAGPRCRIEPLRAALQLTHTFGSRFFTRLPDRYPSRYYIVPTAWYTGVALGGAIKRQTRGGELGLYGELVALPMQLRDWWRNPHVIDASDVVTLAVGAMVGF